MEEIRARGNLTISIDEDYDCLKCRDTGWVDDIKTNSAYPCDCAERRKYQKILESSGLSNAFRSKTFTNYIPERFKTKESVKQARANKKKAMEYTMKFEDIRQTKQNSCLITGQVGSGKTHLALSILNNLMANNIGVKYMEYVSSIKELKQLAMYKEDYDMAINKYKNATVLLIDDLFKKATYRERSGYETVNDTDARIVYEILNYRSLNDKPFIITSEHSPESLCSFDEALGSRMLEQCRGNVIIFNSLDKANFRLWGDYGEV